MDRMTFEQLCHDASLVLGLEDTSALGEGFTVEVRDVLFEFIYAEVRSSVLMLADLGRVAPQQRLEVFESLLALQFTICSQSALHLGFNPTRQTAVLCVNVPLNEDATGAWLASMMSSITDQVAEWRTTVLAGKLQPSAGIEALLDEEPAPFVNAASV